MRKDITGTWIEFQHHNKVEGKPWNDICANFSEDGWNKLLTKMKNDGMEYLVLLATALDDKAYFDSSVYPKADIKCDNPMEVLLSKADELDMKVFLSTGFYDDWHYPIKNMTSAETTKRAFKSMLEICEKFGEHKSIYGWYLPDESCIEGHFSEEFMQYINKYSDFIHSLNKKYKNLIAPYGTNMLIADDLYIKQLESIDIDIVAYQDEVGVRKSNVYQTGAFYEALNKAHKKAGRSALWADMEVFEFEDEVYNSALLPASEERIMKQLDAISPFVERVLCYEYQVFLPDIIKKNKLK